jgi:2-hydroxychromene-2-carboxylate isomerase
MKITWYFDFISPFAYLQSEQLDRLPRETELEYCPILFAGLLNHWGQKGPAEIAPKRRFTYKQAWWMARRESIRLRVPPAHPFNSLGALRLAVALGSDRATVQTIFRFIWAEGHRTDDPASWNALLKRLGAEGDSDRTSSPEVKARLRSNTDNAIARGVFGVPTIASDDELFWGFDTTDMAAAYLADPLLFEDPEMRRLSELPIGVARRS